MRLICRVAGRRAVDDPPWLRRAVPVPDIRARSVDADAILEDEEFDLPWVLARVRHEDIPQRTFSFAENCPSAQSIANIWPWVDQDPRLLKSPPLFLFHEGSGLECLDGALRLAAAKGRESHKTVFILVGDTRPRARRIELGGLTW